MPLIPVGTQTMALLPDRLLVFEPSNVGAVAYRDLLTQRREQRFIEEDTVPSDATTIDRTWKYVNKRGGADRRFKDNRELPVRAYEELEFSSQSGLSEVIQLSRRSSAVNLVRALDQMRAQEGDEPVAAGDAEDAPPVRRTV